MTATSRVLFIENSTGLGGSTLSLCTLLAHIDRAAYEPTVVFSRTDQERYFRDCGGTVTPAATISCGSSLKYRTVGRLALRMSRGLSTGVERRMHTALSLLDLVFVVAPYVARLYRFARRQRITLIHQNNGVDVGAIVLAALLGVPMLAYQRGAEWHSGLVRFFARFVTRYVANSEATKQDLLALGVPASRIDVVYPPIDFTRFDYHNPGRVTRADLGLPQSGPCFASIATLQRLKGHDVFLKAAQRVMAEIPQACALIVGAPVTGSEAYGQELAALAASLGIGDRVIFTGFRNDIPDLLQVIDVLVFASRSAEGFGRVIAEAMAMKKTVVATRTGGPSEIIEHEQTGLLIPTEDDKAMAAAIVRLLRDKSFASELAERAYVRAYDRYSAPVHARKLQEAYDRTLAPRLDLVPHPQGGSLR